MPLKPEIYCLDRTLIDVLIERHPTFDIFWYHWPKDGLLFLVHDYEPVIICYRDDGSLCLVIVRKAWDFQTTPYEEVIKPLRILFDRFQHHPLVLTNQESHSGLDSLHPLHYNEAVILSHQIPDMFRTGRLHPSNYRVVSQEDPIGYATRMGEDFCREQS